MVCILFRIYCYVTAPLRDCLEIIKIWTKSTNRRFLQKIHLKQLVYSIEGIARTIWTTGTKQICWKNHRIRNKDYRLYSILRKRLGIKPEPVHICKPFKEPRNRFPAWLAGTIQPRARICKCLWSPGIDSEESISPAYVAWRASTTNRVSYRPAKLRIDNWSP